MKRMAQQKFCQTCEQKGDCRKIYRTLGDSKSPSVTAQVVLAFLLPLLIFIMTLGGVEKILTYAMTKGHIFDGCELPAGVVRYVHLYRVHKCHKEKVLSRLTTLF